MSKYGRRAAGTPLTEEQRTELRALARMPDAEIDFSDIPERTSELSEHLPLEPHSLTLWVDPKVAAWLETAGERNAARINLLLRRESERSRHLPTPSSAGLHQAN